MLMFLTAKRGQVEEEDNLDVDMESLDDEDEMPDSRIQMLTKIKRLKELLRSLDEAP